MQNNHELLEEIRDDIQEIKVDIAELKVDVRHHIKRSDQLENHVSVLNIFKERVLGASAFLAFLSTLATIYTIFK